MKLKLRKQWIPVAIMFVILCASSILFREWIRKVDNDPVYQEVCIYPVSPKHDCCPEHAELYKEKDIKIDSIWCLSFFVIMMAGMFQSYFIHDLVEAQYKDKDDQNDV